MLPPVLAVLEGWATLTARVGSNIFQGLIDEDVTGDRCVWSVISQVPENLLGEAPQEDSQLIQLDGYSSDKTRAHLIGEALRDAMESVTYVVSGPVYSYESDTKLHRWRVDASFWTSREVGLAVPLQIPFGGVKSANFNVDNTSRAYRFNVISPDSAAATLPLASTCDGAVYIFDLGVSDGVCSIALSGSDTVDGDSGPFVLLGNTIFYSDGVAGFIRI
jgi:hypothetical protein